MHNFFKNLNVSIENKGEELIISIKGNKEKLAAVEKKLNALKELCDDSCCKDCC